MSTSTADDAFDGMGEYRDKAAEKAAEQAARDAELIRLQSETRGR